MVRPKADGTFEIQVPLAKSGGILEVQIRQETAAYTIRYDLDKKKQIQ